MPKKKKRQLIAILVDYFLPRKNYFSGTEVLFLGVETLPRLLFSFIGVISITSISKTKQSEYMPVRSVTVTLFWGGKKMAEEKGVLYTVA